MSFVSPGVLELEEGVLYVDSGSEVAAMPGVSVRTPLGLVHEMGTQFEVAVEQESLRVRVRRGAVSLEAEDGSWDAAGGMELTLERDGELERRELSIHGPEWDWVQEVAPTFPLEGQTLDEFLAWVSRETGRSTRLADGELARESERIVLHGSVEGLTPTQAVEAVLPTCGLVFRWTEETLDVSRQTPTS